MKYRSKPVIIEAYPVPMSADDTLAWQELSAFMGREVGPEPPIIYAREGEEQSRPGDFIIKDVQGNFYPCSPEHFHYNPEAAAADTERAYQNYLSGESE